MAERKLPGRRKRRKSGRPVRLSNMMLNYLSPRMKDSRSFDAYLRRTYGLPDWRGNPQPLVEGYIEVTTGRFFLKTDNGGWEKAEADAYELAITEAARLKTKKVNKPIRVREIA